MKRLTMILLLAASTGHAQNGGTEAVGRAERIETFDLHQVECLSQNTGGDPNMAPCQAGKSQRSHLSANDELKRALEQMEKIKQRRIVPEGSAFPSLRDDTNPSKSGSHSSPGIRSGER